MSASERRKDAAEEWALDTSEAPRGEQERADEWLRRYATAPNEWQIWETAVFLQQRAYVDGFQAGIRHAEERAALSEDAKE
jgi:hypothetical protein